MARAELEANFAGAGASAGRVVDALIAEANYRGGLDNITAIVVQVLQIDSPNADAPTQEGPAFGA